MSTRAIFILLLVLTSSPAAAGQESSRAEQEALRLVNEHARRIATLEAQLARLQDTLDALRRQQEGAKPPDATAAAQPAPTDRAPYEHAVDGTAPADVDPEAPTGDLPRALPVDVYGSLRVISAMDTRGHSEIRNNATRLGLRGEKALALGGRLTAFGRVELGINLVDNDRVILVSGDPGTPIGQGSQALASRLGYVGVKTPVGSVSWGKQWAVYYDVAEFTDQFHVFGGAATGAWAAGTDGGTAGTGRAERAFQYREARGPVAFGVQVQNRTTSPNDRSWADTWSVSAVVGRWNGFDAGAAYNEVRDGVAEPTANDPRLGNKAAIFGLRYRNDQWYAAGTFSILKQHEIDDLGRVFDGRGFELALRRTLTERVSIEGGYNDLRPDKEHPGDFRVQFGLANVVYHFGNASRVFLGFRIEDSRRTDGARLTESALAAGLNYTF